MSAASPRYSAARPRSMRASRRRASTPPPPARSPPPARGEPAASTLQSPDLAAAGAQAGVACPPSATLRRDGRLSLGAGPGRPADLHLTSAQGDLAATSASPRPAAPRCAARSTSTSARPRRAGAARRRRAPAAARAAARGPRLPHPARPPDPGQPSYRSPPCAPADADLQLTAALAACGGADLPRRRRPTRCCRTARLRLDPVSTGIGPATRHADPAARRRRRRPALHLTIDARRPAVRRRARPVRRPGRRRGTLDLRADLHRQPATPSAPSPRR